MIEIEDIRIPWCESPFLDPLLERAALPDDEEAKIRAFAQDGLFRFDLTAIDGFDALSRKIVTSCQKIEGYDFRAQDAWNQISEVRDLAALPEILKVLTMLYRSAPIPMQTLNFGKGTEQRAHSDDFHFSCHPKGFMCGVWVALEDVDADNGPLVYYPGSHRLPYLDLSHIDRAGSRQQNLSLYPEYEEMVQATIRGAGLEAREVHLKRGEAVVWAANLFHGGAPIRDPDRTRHSQVTHYYFGPCLYYQPQRSDPVAGKVSRLEKPDIRTGAPIAHKLAGQPFATRGVVYRALDKVGLVQVARAVRDRLQDR